MAGVLFLAISTLLLCLLTPAVSEEVSKRPSQCLFQRAQAVGSAQEKAEFLVVEDANPYAVDTNELANTVKKMMEEIDQSTEKNRGKNGTSKDVRDTVTTMMKTFQGMATEKFKKAFDHTQKLIAAKVADLQEKTKGTRAKQDATDKANLALGVCRGEEKKKLRTWEHCRNEGEWSNRTWKDACKEMEDSQFHEWEIEDELTELHRCDLAVKNCPKLDDLKKHVDEHFKEAAAKRTWYRKAVKTCKDAEDSALDLQQDCDDKFQAYFDKKAECDYKEYSMKLDLCSFGRQAQTKCVAYKKLTEFNQEVREGKDAENSEKYRMDQWKEAETLRCMLKSYTGGGGTDEKIKELCESKVNYKRDIGVMDYHPQQIMQQMQPAPEQITCKETELIFKGPSWTVSNTTEDFKKEDVFTQNISFALTEPPFEVCKPPDVKATCRGFSCPAEFPDRTSDSAACHLSKCTIYECCQNAIPGGAGAEAAEAAPPAAPAAATPAKAPAAAPAAAATPPAATPAAAPPAPAP